jgi:hypothetical protein
MPSSGSTEASCPFAVRRLSTILASSIRAAAVASALRMPRFGWRRMIEVWVLFVSVAPDPVLNPDGVISA